MSIGSEERSVSRRSARAQPPYSWLLLAMVVNLGTLHAQEPPRGEFSEELEVRVAEIDIVVVDEDGIPVAGLGRDDFEIFEDGNRVELTNFFAYGDARRPATGVSPGAAAEGASKIPDTGPTLFPTEPPPLTWLVFVDQHALNPGPRADLLRRLRKFAAETIRPQDRALVTSFDGLALRVHSEPSLGPEPVARALEHLELHRGFVSRFPGRRRHLESEILRSEPPVRSRQMEAERLLGEVDQLAEEEVAQTAAAIAAARDALALAGGVDGRVIVLFCGAGFESRPAESLYAVLSARFAQLRHVNRELESRWAEIERLKAQLLAAAASRRFAIYSIHSGTSGPNVSAESPGGVGFAVPAPDASQLSAGSLLSALARETGGRTFVAAPDLERRLERVRDDLGNYYSLGYRPITDRPGRRSVEVRVRREGLHVQHRPALVTRTARERAADAAVGALFDPAGAVRPSDVLLEVTTEDGSESGRARKRKVVKVLVRVPLRSVRLVTEGDTHRGMLWFQFAVRAADGALQRLEPRPLELRLSDRQLASALGQHIVFEATLPLPVGDYRLAATVLDENAETWSSVATDVTVAR